MAAKRIDIMDIRQLLQLKNKGLSNRKIAEKIGVHRNSINHYVRLFKASDKSYESLLLISDEGLLELFPIPSTTDKNKYEDLSSYFSYFHSELKKPGCTRQVLWNEYLCKHPQGYGYTQFNLHFNRWLKQVKASGKLHHKAGDKVYIDYSGKKLSYIDKATGEVIDVEVFVGILPCSGYTFVEASCSQKLEDFIGSMNNCLHYFGGVPQAIVPDNLKSAVTKGSKYEPILNKTFKDFALHYGCAINPTRTYSPQDKALVEGAVKLVYQRIFYPLSKMTFFSLTDLNQEISRLLQAYNDYLLTHLKVSRRQQFLTIEKDFLSALPTQNYELKYYKKETVQKMGYIFLSQNKNYYSVPYRFIGKKVTVSYNQQTVEIHYKKERIATHQRSFRSGHYVTIKEHLSSSHNFYTNWSPAFFQKMARPYGASVVQYIDALIEQAAYPEVAYKQCLGIIALSKTYEKYRLNNACKRGLTFHRYGYHIIKNILENKMDIQQSAALIPTDEISQHENIRGATYYQ
jgi:transposase